MSSSLPADYAERVYAGVLGKIIGVYLGRPVEGWTYDRIATAHGEVDHYLPGLDGAPLVVTDDDISGTFIFLRALPDRGNDPDLSPAEIGESWLNYLVERQTILWWGGIGNSTEHTAYLRLKAGVPAPESGSIALNGKTIAEQIGAQIFIDGWGMICPGDPERAADFARRAGSVSHDGEAIFGAQVVAAMEAQAFVESDLNALLDTAVGLIPADSTIRRLIDDLREWHAAEPDWRKTRERIAAKYGYDKYVGNCHMVPNHALIVHALLHGDDDFGRSLMIVNTCGWDTDCNSGNVGCILGIKNGLAGIDRDPYDWRGPVADRLYLSSADGGRAISDALREADAVVDIGRALAGDAPARPKGGARFHFSLPGAVQGFRAEGGATVENAAWADGAEANGAGNGNGNAAFVGREERDGGGPAPCRLALRFDAEAAGQAFSAVTPTFVPEEALAMPGYVLLASPTLYPGQTVRATIAADPANAGTTDCRLLIRTYGSGDALETALGETASLAPGEETELVWRISDTGGAPIAEVGIEATPQAAGPGSVFLDRLGWDGAPDARFARPDPAHDGTMWRRAWASGVDQWEARWREAFRIVQNRGTGLVSTGTADWDDYRAAATVTVNLADRAGLAARVGGLRRWYALLLGRDGVARLVKSADGERVLAEAPFAWQFDVPYDLALEVQGNRVRGTVGDVALEATDDDRPLPSGGVALVVTEGCLACDAVEVGPLG